MACDQVMIVEDEMDLRETLKDLLEMTGFRAYTAENGEEGLKLLTEKGNPCLILLDLMMPVMNGWEFLDKLKNEYKETLSSIPVIVVSAAADLTDVRQRYDCHVLKKPVNIQNLISVTREHCKAARTSNLSL